MSKPMRFSWRHTWWILLAAACGVPDPEPGPETRGKAESDRVVSLVPEEYDQLVADEHQRAVIYRQLDVEAQGSHLLVLPAPRITDLLAPERVSHVFDFHTDVEKTYDVIIRLDPDLPAEGMGTGWFVVDGGEDAGILTEFECDDEAEGDRSQRCTRPRGAYTLLACPQGQCSLALDEPRIERSRVIEIQRLRRCSALRVGIYPASDGGAVAGRLRVSFTVIAER